MSFVKLSDPSTLEPIYVNMHQVLYYRKNGKSAIPGTVIYMADGAQIEVRQTIDDINAMLMTNLEKMRDELSKAID